MRAVIDGRVTTNKRRKDDEKMSDHNYSGWFVTFRFFVISSFRLLSFVAKIRKNEEKRLAKK